MGQECQKCQNKQEGHSNEIQKQEVISSDSDPEYEEEDEKQPQKPPSMDSKSNSSTFIKEQYFTSDSKQEQIESSQNQIKFQDGGIYTGQTINNMANGLGMLVMPNGDIYEGSFDNNKLEGDGKCIYSRGPIYTGQFKQGKSNGFGKEVWPDGSVYEGEFRNGKKNGKGIYKWSQQSTYNGEWVDNVINGIGKYEWPDENSLIMVNGSEIKCMVEGSINGLMENIMMENMKMIKNVELVHFDIEECIDIIIKIHLINYIFNWSDGKQYQGYWLDGKQHGKGLMIDKEGKKKFGEWQNGKLITCYDESNLQLIPDGWFLNTFNQ